MAKAVAVQYEEKKEEEKEEEEEEEEEKEEDEDSDYCESEEGEASDMSARATRLLAKHRAKAKERQADGAARKAAKKEPHMKKPAAKKKKSPHMGPMDEDVARDGSDYIRRGRPRTIDEALVGLPLQLGLRPAGMAGTSRAT